MLRDYGGDIAEVGFEYEDIEMTMARVTANVSESTGLVDPLAGESGNATLEWLSHDSILNNTNDDVLGEGAGINSTSRVTAYADGMYTATGEGSGGPFEVTVAIVDGAVASVEVGPNDETGDIGSMAIVQLPAAIVASNGTVGVEGVAGASVTSEGILSAVDECLLQAAAAAIGAEMEPSPKTSVNALEVASEPSDPTPMVYYLEDDITPLYIDIPNPLPYHGA